MPISNATKSSGSRTQIGKSVSGQNGQTHGLDRSIHPHLPEETAAHPTSLTEYIDAFNPEGLLERDLAQSTAKAGTESAAQKASRTTSSRLNRPACDRLVDFPAENGFGFSNEEISAYIDRKRRPEAAKVLFSGKLTNPKSLARAASGYQLVKFRE